MEYPTLIPKDKGCMGEEEKTELLFSDIAKVKGHKNHSAAILASVIFSSFEIIN